MKGGGSRLNVNTDKPHSLISIKNKVLPTSPPARQSPQATPTAARSWRPGEREPGEPLAAPRRLPGPRFPPARPPDTAGSAHRPAAARGSGPGHLAPRPPGTPSRAGRPRACGPRAAAHPPASARGWGFPPAALAVDSTEAPGVGGGGDGHRCLLASLAPRESGRPSGPPPPPTHPSKPVPPQPRRRSRTRGRSTTTTTTITSEPDLLRPRSLLNPGKNVSFTWPRAAGARAPGGGFSAPT